MLNFTELQLWNADFLNFHVVQPTSFTSIKSAPIANNMTMCELDHDLKAQQDT